MHKNNGYHTLCAYQKKEKKGKNIHKTSQNSKALKFSNNPMLLLRYLKLFHVLDERLLVHL